MKMEPWPIVVALLVVLALGGIAGMHTVRSSVIDRQQAELTAQALTIAILGARVEEMLPPPYCEPLEGARISSGCGYRVNPMGGDTESLHRGVDLVGPLGAPVRAVRAGVVVEHWLAPGTVRDGKTYRGHDVFGGYIVIDHGGFFACYGHLWDTYVREGWRVEMGQVIGALGDTGIATGPHLHFEVVVSPLRFLEGR